MSPPDPYPARTQRSVIDDPAIPPPPPPPPPSSRAVEAERAAPRARAVPAARPPARAAHQRHVGWAWFIAFLVVAAALIVTVPYLLTDSPRPSLDPALNPAAVGASVSTDRKSVVEGKSV